MFVKNGDGMHVRELVSPYHGGDTMVVSRKVTLGVHGLLLRLHGSHLDFYGSCTELLFKKESVLIVDL